MNGDRVVNEFLNLAKEDEDLAHILSGLTPDEIQKLEDAISTSADAVIEQRLRVEPYN